MYDERRRNGELAAAKRIGREEGMEEGLEKGREEGRAEGRAEGREEGRLETAEKLKRLGVDLQTIVQATGLEADVIARL